MTYHRQSAYPVRVPWSRSPGFDPRHQPQRRPGRGLGLRTTQVNYPELSLADCPSVPSAAASPAGRKSPAPWPQPSPAARYPSGDGDTALSLTRSCVPVPHSGHTLAHRPNSPRTSCSCHWRKPWRHGAYPCAGPGQSRILLAYPICHRRMPQAGRGLGRPLNRVNAPRSSAKLPRRFRLETACFPDDKRTGWRARFTGRDVTPARSRPDV